MTDLADVVTEAIADDRKDFGTPTNWRISNLGKCIRYQVLNRLGVTPTDPFSATTLSLFRMGDLIEEDTLNLLGNKVTIITRDVHGRRIPVEVPAFHAKGAIDALVVVDGKMAVLEIKSTRDRALSFGDLPYQTHEKQTRAYAHFLGLKDGYLVYRGRDGAVKAFHVDATDVTDITAEWIELERWWHGVTVGALVEPSGLPPKKSLIQATKTVKGKKVPFVYEKSGPWGDAGDPKMELDSECERCAYRTYCWGVEGEAARAEGGAEVASGATPDGQPEEGGVPSSERVLAD